MNLKYWDDKNMELFSKAIDILADAVMEQYICGDDLDNATDLAECDGYDIEMFYSLLKDNRFYHYQLSTDEPFSIKEFNDENTGYLGVRSVFQEYVSDTWEEILEDEPELTEAINDRIAVGRIVDKYAFGGGGFEVQREIEIGVSDRVAERMKNLRAKRETENETV